MGKMPEAQNFLIPPRNIIFKPNLDLPYCIYSAIKQGFPLSIMTINSYIGHMEFDNKRVLSFLNNPRDLDLSCKMDLYFCNCFGRKIILSYSRRNMV